jgi:hypothetical protein
MKARILFVLLLAASSLWAAAPASAATTCTGTGARWIRYHDFGGDIFGIYAKMYFCYNTLDHTVTISSKSRGFATWDIAWSWCGWQSSTVTGGYDLVGTAKVKVYWKQWYSKGCFDAEVPTIGNQYPNQTLRVYGNGTVKCWGYAYNGASKVSC